MHSRLHFPCFFAEKPQFPFLFEQEEDGDDDEDGDEDEWKIVTTCWSQVHRLQTGWNQKVDYRDPWNVTTNQSEEGSQADQASYTLSLTLIIR